MKLPSTAGVAGGLAVMLLVALTGPVPAAAAKPGKQKKFVAEGEILLPGITQLTFLGFLLTCPDMPPTQGMSEYIVPIPDEFSRGNAIATIEGSNPVSTYNFDMWFHASDCGGYEPGVDPPTYVPAGTGFIAVRNFYDAASTFKLTLEIDPQAEATR